MKKHILAVSVAAALGVSGSAFGATTVNEGGFGHTNIIPYFSTQGNNVTHLHITNTDSVNGKAVKVRFRGAEWSDDLFDFTLFLSPGDAWAGEVSSDGSVSQLRAFDNSCTLPTYVKDGNAYKFSTYRLSGDKAAGTREGYTEIITMADIPPGSTLYTAIKHVKGVAPCTATVLEGLVPDHPWETVNPSQGMTDPNEGTLTSWARVLDIVGIKAYGYQATAINYTNPRKIYFTQKNDTLVASRQYTSDMIFFDAGSTDTAATTAAPLTTMYQFDMPDLSTPVEALNPATTAAVTQRNNLAAQIQKSVIETDYATNPDVGGATDIVLNQPVRRYFYKFTAGSGDVEGTNFARYVGSSKFDVTGHPNSTYNDFSGSLAKANRIQPANLTGTFRPSSAYSGQFVFWDRSEYFVQASTGIVISPQPPTVIDKMSLAGEVSVISLNNNAGTVTGAIGGVLTMNDITATTDATSKFTSGWFALSTTTEGTNKKLPIIGFTAMKVTGTDNFGTTLRLNYIQ